MTQHTSQHKDKTPPPRTETLCITEEASATVSTTINPMTSWDGRGMDSLLKALAIPPLPDPKLSP